jgi:hypothetical protein
MRLSPPITLRNDIPVVTCAGPGCTNALAPHTVGRPARYCSTACRVRDHRHRTATTPITVEVDMGSATSRGRPPERAWLVRIRRGDSYVIVNTGLRRPHADRLAAQLTDLLTDKSPRTP